MKDKIDHKKELKHLYKPSKKNPEIIEVPEMNFLMIDGKGNPNTSKEYSEAVSALYSLAYSIKFNIKKTTGVNYAVMPLEGLWWVEDMDDFSTDSKEDWLWTMMIMQPDLVTSELIEENRETVIKKKSLPKLGNIYFQPYNEGLSVQLMHIGPYADEAPNISRMHQFAFDQGYKLAGKHHEIYLNDPNRTAPENLKTVLRQPISKD
jgi:hypothetical protein